MEALLEGDLPLALAIHSGSYCAGLRAVLGDFGVTLMVAGNIPDRTQTVAVAIFPMPSNPAMARSREFSC